MADDQGVHRDAFGEESWDEFRDKGLLWLINAAVFHPRGFALCLVYDDDGHCTGWKMIGNGSERWRFAEEGFPPGETPDDRFLQVEAFLDSLRPQGDLPT